MHLHNYVFALQETLYYYRSLLWYSLGLLYGCLFDNLSGTTTCTLSINLKSVHIWKIKKIQRHHENTGFLPLQKQRCRSAVQRLCFRCTYYSTIPLLPKSEISSVYPSSLDAKAGLSQTWSETPKTGFLVPRLN